MKFRSFLVLLSFFLPVAIPLPNMAGKPVDLVFSDLIILFGLLCLMFYRKITLYSYEVSFSFICLGLFFFYALTGVVGVVLDGEMTPLMSSLRFSKAFLIPPTLFVLNQARIIALGEFPQLIQRLSVAFFLILFVSTIFFQPNFPFPRWGSSFLGLEVYGFPNSAAFYYVTVFTLLWWKSPRIIAFLFITTLCIFISMTLSRNAIISLLFSGLLLVVASNSLVKIYSTAMALVAAILVMVFYSALEQIIEPLVIKLEIALGTAGGDPLSGRGDIWNVTLDAISSSPVFGHFFSPFSRLGLGFDTPHQQYLEIAFKAGLIGLVLFLLFNIYLALICIRAHALSSSKSTSRLSIILLIILATASISNLAQPNFSYSIFANFFLMLFSVLLREIGVEMRELDGSKLRRS